jgi:hypothetical protein
LFFIKIINYEKLDHKTYNSIGLVSWWKGLQTHKPVPEDEVGSPCKISAGFPLLHPWLAQADL